jgi:hypothetical protein
VKASTPPMTGALQMTTKFLLPPGDKDVVEKLQLDGRFAIARRGPSRTTTCRERIEELSKRGSAKTQRQRASTSRRTSRGASSWRNGRLELPELTFSVPGAGVQLAGVYGLTTETMDFTGKAAAGRQNFTDRHRFQVGAPQGR